MERLHKLFSYLTPLLAASLFFGLSQAQASDVVLNAQYEYLDAYVIGDDGSYTRRVFIDPDPVMDSQGNTVEAARVGRHVNGQLCFFPSTAGSDFAGKFLIADDTYREACVETNLRQARCDAPDSDLEFVGKDADGWGVFNADGTWAKRVIQTDDFSCDEVAKTCVQPIGTVDPQGCAFDAAGNFFGTDVNAGAIGVAKGALIVFFNNNGDVQANYQDYCIVATGLGAPGMPVVADAGKSIIFTEATTSDGPLGALGDLTGRDEFRANAGRVLKFSFTSPLSQSDCNLTTHELKTSGTAKMTRSDFMTFPADGVVTPESITQVPDGFEFGGPLAKPPHYYVGSVLLPPVINEYDTNGSFVRNIVLPLLPKNPIGMGVGKDGTLYYAELNLGPNIKNNNPETLDPFATGCGRVSRVRFVQGVPLIPEVLQDNLAFPDGVTVVDSSQLNVTLSSLPDAPAPDSNNCKREGPTP